MESTDPSVAMSKTTVNYVQKNKNGGKHSNGENTGNNIIIMNGQYNMLKLNTQMNYNTNKSPYKINRKNQTTKHRY